ncbi:MAG TPA: small multi-drug export protein [Candidatus Thermoplasmatota archaeon]|nr:small multi-drug export protein [Candidatus Thermoplasmatota archaeon]
MTTLPSPANANAPSSWWRIVPGLAFAAGIALLVFVAARGWFIPSAKLAVAYFVTPLAKEAWVAAAEPIFGLPAPYAVFLLLCVEASVVLVVLLAFPVERLARFAPKVARFEARVRASRLARRGLALALAAIIALPFHSGGGILGTLAGRALGLPRWHTFFAVLGGIAVRFLVVLAAYEGYLALT